MEIIDAAAHKPIHELKQQYVSVN